MDVSIIKIKKHTDERGALVEFLTTKDITEKHDSFGHLFFVRFDNEKAIRGNHYHEYQNEYYGVVEGKVKVILIDIKTKEKKTVTLSPTGKYFTKLRIGPYIAHASYALTKSAVLLSYYSRPYDKDNRDTKPYVVIKK